MNGLPTAQARPESNLRVKTFTFGCKVNKSDTTAIERNFRSAGASIVRNGDCPDVIVVNTCTVTHSADRKARQLLRRLHRENPTAKIVVTGCYAEADPQTLKGIEGISNIVPIRDQNRIPSIFGLEDLSSNENEISADLEGNTRAFLKLQDGCNAYCSFCVLPYIRGRSRSTELQELANLAHELSLNGYREIVVTGTHIGAYGRDLQPRAKFSDALGAIIDAAPGVHIRVSSLEPTTLTADVIKFVERNDAVRPHFHIPLQSGSDSVLKRMNRKYSSKNFRERILALASTRPTIGIGTDIIVGFPGETDEEFAETFNLVSELPITFLHLFRYSPRPGTKAAQFENSIPNSVVSSRMKIMQQLGNTKRDRFYDSFLETTQSVLVEKKRDAEGRLTGYTPHYVPVRFMGPERLKTREVKVRLLKREREIVVGEML